LFFFGLFVTKGKFEKERKNFVLLSATSVLSNFLVYPFSLIRNRMMLTSLSKHKYRNFRELTKKIITEEGIIGLWRGASILFIINTISMITIYLLNKSLEKDQLKKSHYR